MVRHFVTRKLFMLLALTSTSVSLSNCGTETDALKLTVADRRERKLVRGIVVPPEYVVRERKLVRGIVVPPEYVVPGNLIEEIVVDPGVETPRGEGVQGEVVDEDAQDQDPYSCGVKEPDSIRQRCYNILGIESKSGSRCMFEYYTNYQEGDITKSRKYKHVDVWGYEPKVPEYVRNPVTKKWEKTGKKVLKMDTMCLEGNSGETHMVKKMKNVKPGRVKFYELNEPVNGHRVHKVKMIDEMKYPGSTFFYTGDHRYLERLVREERKEKDGVVVVNHFTGDKRWEDLEKSDVEFPNGEIHQYRYENGREFFVGSTTRAQRELHANAATPAVPSSSSSSSSSAKPSSRGEATATVAGFGLGLLFGIC